MLKYPAHPARILSRPATVSPSESMNVWSGVISDASASMSCRLMARTNSLAAPLADWFMVRLYDRKNLYGARRHGAPERLDFGEAATPPTMRAKDISAREMRCRFLVKLFG